jgi:hypothetical protein
MDLSALNDLLASSEEFRNDSACNTAKLANASPASVIPSTIVKRGDTSSRAEKSKLGKSEQKEKVDGAEIWDETEVQTSEELQLQVKDSRKRPDYDVLYKQRVGSEDLYLGIGEVTPASASCEMIVLKIALPGDSISDLDLDVKKQTLVLKSKIHHLATYLPHPVDHNSGEAKWDGDKCVLSVTLPLLE